MSHSPPRQRGARPEHSRTRRANPRTIERLEDRRLLANHAPAGANKTVTTLEDTAYTFTAADFGFSDASDSPPNTLSAVEVSTLPTAGALANNGVAVTTGQFISLANINSGKLTFSPAAN